MIDIQQRLHGHPRRCGLPDQAQGVRHVVGGLAANVDEAAARLCGGEAGAGSKAVWRGRTPCTRQQASITADEVDG